MCFNNVETHNKCNVYLSFSDGVTACCPLPIDCEFSRVQPC